MFPFARVLHQRVLHLVGRHNNVSLLSSKSQSWSIRNCLRKHSQLATQQTRLMCSHSTSNQDVLSVKNEHLHRYLQHLEQKFEDAERKIMLQESSLKKEELREVHTTITTLGPVVYRLRDFYSKEKELREFDDMIKDLLSKGDHETAEIAKLERSVCANDAEGLEHTLLDQLLPPEKADDFDIILEVSAGVGGQEAMLFTGDMFAMYEKFALYCDWDFQVMGTDESDKGGLRKASALISGEDVYKMLKFEGGVHRVQRVPRTEKSGRIHTSTMTVAVMPRPTEIDIQVNMSDIRTDTFRASGAGGQHVNTTNSAVRVTHNPTGIVVECQAGRSQIRNREMALDILRSRIYEKELKEQTRQQKSTRKLQAGSQARSDKLRTYNFQQDRVTDHRIHKNIGNISGFMDGGEQLEELILDLLEESKREQLVEMLEDFTANQDKKKRKK